VEQIIGSEGTIELEAGKFYSENPPPSPGIQQLIRDIENQVFKTVPIGGPSWILNDSNKAKAEYLVDDLRIPSPTQLELEAFIESIKSGKPLPDLLAQSYYASLSAILANRAIDEQKMLSWPDETIL
jgi:hypothetical protein